jgi:TonB family protein
MAFLITPFWRLLLVRPMRSLLLVAALVTVALPAAWAYEPAGLTNDGRLVRPNKNDRRIPWHVDLLEHPHGEYPYAARVHYRTGKGWFRLELRPNGSVATVRVMQTTGSADLDAAAIGSLSRWRFRPGKWKWVDEFIAFRMPTSDRGVLGQPSF